MQCSHVTSRILRRAESNVMRQFEFGLGDADLVESSTVHPACCAKKIEQNGQSCMMWRIMQEIAASLA